MSKASLFLILPVAILFSFGLLMIFNTTAAQIIDQSLSTDTHSIFFKQSLYAGLGIIAGSMVFHYGYKSLLRFSIWGLVFGIVLLVLLFVPGIGQTVNGARRWIGCFGFTFQPSECIKLFLPAAFIHWACEQKEISFVPFCKMVGLFLVPLALIFLQPDNGTIVIMLVTLFVLFWLTKIKWRYWALPLFLVFIVASVAAYQMPHVRNRIQIYLHPELDLLGKGHQPHQAKVAAGSGGLFGRGIGESLQKLNYLPEARNDYIAAIFAEETGFIGILGIIALYMFFAFAGFFIAIKSHDMEGFLFASILTFLISIQAFLNLGVVSGLLPSKGMTLPFFSQGGTSLIVNIVALFLLLDISYNSKAIQKS
ncbi:MAG TPA: putative peptidoglycan glycosyltransferase FtsW [Chlamydiales bacterium]|nr:putative peptidoglycan glycosyltransferase FtsW [Chlamydiales bacterium]